MFLHGFLSIFIGNYRYFKAEKGNQIIKFFNPRIALNKITLKITTPDGKLINFGKSILIENKDNNHKLNNLDDDDIINEKSKQKNITEDDGAIFNSFIFKITCIQRSLDTMYLDKRDG